MNRIADTPELQAAITAVLKDPATIIVSEIQTLSKKTVSAWISALFTFLRDNEQEMGAIPYAVELESSDKGNSPISAKTLIKHLKSGFNIFKMDDKLKIVGLDNFEFLSVAAISQYSRKNKSVVLHIINGIDFIIYANGVIVKEMNTRRPAMRALVYKNTTRSGYDYELSIQEHYKNRVRFSQACNHWHDRTNRILVGGRKTEEVFQESLLNWLVENIHDSKVVGKVKKLSKDETDIEIFTLQGIYFLIEIKWLGKNSSGTVYSKSKIGDGITQVKNYLTIDKEVSEATLVVYDGRSLEHFYKIKHIEDEPGQWKQIATCCNKKLPARGKAYVFFLENKDASRRK